MLSNQSLLRFFIPVLLFVLLVWILFKYSSIQQSIDTSTNELLKIDKALGVTNTNAGGAGTKGTTGAQSEDYWIQQLLQEGEIIWRESKNKRVAAIEELGTYFKDKPWHYFAYTIFWDFFTPAFHCPRPVERVGRVGDGGKWICAFTQIAKRESERRPCIVYSYGISDEITFEEEVLHRSKCLVRMFDPTINVTVGKAADLVKKYPDRATLLKIGLGIENKNDLRTLKKEMELNGDEFIDILKMDIEGIEFHVMNNIIKDFPAQLPFGQLQIELHLVNLRGDILDYFAKWIDHLEDAGLRAFFSEPNQIPNVMRNNGYVDYIEYAFLNSKLDLNYFE